jgi:hypothetical protein
MSAGHGDNDASAGDTVNGIFFGKGHDAFVFSLPNPTQNTLMDFYKDVWGNNSGLAEFIADHLKTMSVLQEIVHPDGANTGVVHFGGDADLQGVLGKFASDHLLV